MNYDVTLTVTYTFHVQANSEEDAGELVRNTKESERAGLGIGHPDIYIEVEGVDDHTDACFLGNNYELL